MNNPLVTILVANHNYQEWLGESIESARNQDYENVQIVVVDDGSTDGSQSKIKYYADKDSRIIPIYLDKCTGASEARNIGLRRVWDTPSDFFMVLDSDDIAHPNKVREMLQKIMVSPMVGGCYANYLILNEATKNITQEFKEPFDARIMQQRCIVSSSAMMTRAALDKVKEYNEKGEFQWWDPNLHGPADQEFQNSCEDWELGMRISEHFLYISIAKTLSTSRVHNRNASQIEKVSKTWAKTAEYLQQKALKRQGKI